MASTIEEKPRLTLKERAAKLGESLQGWADAAMAAAAALPDEQRSQEVVARDRALNLLQQSAEAFQQVLP